MGASSPSVRRHLPLALLLGVAVRAPFWAEALRTPVNGDTAIIGLMSRHLGRGTTLWGQPYGSPLEAALAAPFVATLGTTTAAIRIPYFLLGLALIPLGYALGRALHAEAALPAPLYPATLVLSGLLLVLSLRLAERFAAGERPVSGEIAWVLLAALSL